MAVLRSSGPTDSVLPLAELARRTGLPKGAVHRVAGDLVTHRLLDKTPHGLRLSGGLFELGMRPAAERTLLELAMPFLQDLYERTMRPSTSASERAPRSCTSPRSAATARPPHPRGRAAGCRCTAPRWARCCWRRATPGCARPC